MVVLADGERFLVERVVAVEHPLRLRAVQLADPGSDEHRCDGVAREVGQGPCLRHEPIDADDQADAVEQLRSVRLQAARQRRKARAADTGGALRRDDHEQ